jgi:cytochrome c-type biogenesis protein CcmH/NrfG
MGRRAARATIPALAVLLAATFGPAGADPSDPSPAVEERRQSPAAASAASEYMRGVRARVIADWPAAESAFRGAIALEPTHAEAWNELGYALRNQRRYAESLDAYHEALRLRPEFPEALEYLGEAYVDMNRLDEARGVLARLRPLDRARAQELAEAIQKRSP